MSPPSTAERYRLRRDAELTEYPDSQHGFDTGLPGVSNVRVAANARSVRIPADAVQAGITSHDELNRRVWNQMNPATGFELFRKSNMEVIR